MTTTEPTTMQAGRELDAEVATRVMGWSLRPVEYGRDSYLFAGKYPGTQQGPGDVLLWASDGKPFGYFPTWKPSSDVAAAWKVVEHTRAVWAREFAGASKQLCPYWTFVDCGEEGWRVDLTLGCDDGDVPVSSHSAPTFPLALCAAALGPHGWATPSPTPEAPADAR